MWDNQKRAFVAINSTKEISILGSMANRHGLIAGATGTGKTITLQTLSETFSDMGVPVFVADVKGDLSGVAQEGGNKESVINRVEKYNLKSKGFEFKRFPTQFWDVFGEEGIPLRLTIADLGASLLSRILNLNDTQSSILSVIFKVSQDENIELIDLNDLQTFLDYISKNKNNFSSKYGAIPPVSVNIIKRKLLDLEQEKGNLFFGEPSINLDDFIKKDSSGRGIINILASDKLINSPRIYSSFLLWMMTKLFEVLPEAGDLDKPKLVFFFDEAHLLFKELPNILLDKIEQVVRLIRSKGVGVYFVSQSPSDIPPNILGQLGNRIQHALRAYTPNDVKILKATAQTFRSNSSLDTEKVISELGIGEALVSFLDEKGVPQEVERAFILPPQSQIGPITSQERKDIVTSSLLYSYYSRPIKRDTAHEILSKKIAEEEQQQQMIQEKVKLEKENKQANKTSKNVSRLYTSLFLPILRSVILSFIRSMGKKK